MNYLDTGILISALYLRDSNQERCAALIENGVTSVHSFAEAFSTLTGQYRLKNDIVTEALLELRANMRVEALLPEDYFEVIESAKSRGVMGGLIYDALHARVARRLSAKKLYTFNASNFKHVAPDLMIESP